MKCIMCKHGNVIDGTTTVTLERHNTTIVFKDVPARICENCGEAYIDDSVSTGLLNHAEKIAEQGTEVDIRHYQAA